MDNISIEISENTLSVDKCYQFILSDDCGGNCLFVGTTRNLNKGSVVQYLDFESYVPMAKSEMKKIANKAMDTFKISKIAIHHRVGQVNIKDIAVVIAVSSKHRKNAFLACEFAIDELKKSVPIWKKEYLNDGSFWINATP